LTKYDKTKLRFACTEVKGEPKKTIQSEQDLSFKVFFGSPFTIANLIQFDIFILKKNTF